MFLTVLNGFNGHVPREHHFFEWDGIDSGSDALHADFVGGTFNRLYIFDECFGFFDESVQKRVYLMQKHDGIVLILGSVSFKVFDVIDDDINLWLYDMLYLLSVGVGIDGLLYDALV